MLSTVLMSSIVSVLSIIPILSFSRCVHIMRLVHCPPDVACQVPYVVCLYIQRSRHSSGRMLEMWTHRRDFHLSFITNHHVRSQPSLFEMHPAHHRQVADTSGTAELRNMHARDADRWWMVLYDPPIPGICARRNYTSNPSHFRPTRSPPPIDLSEPCLEANALDKLVVFQSTDRHIG
jgi:hypothetical protein